MPDRSGMEFYIKDQTTGENLQIPVNPSDVKLKYETDDHSETIVNLGEVNIPGKTKLVGVEIKSVFPTVGAHYVATKTPHKQATYVKKIKKIQSRNHKVRFVVTKTDISMLMTIASFEYGLENGWSAAPRGRTDTAQSCTDAPRCLRQSAATLRAAAAPGQRAARQVGCHRAVPAAASPGTSSDGHAARPLLCLRCGRAVRALAAE